MFSGISGISATEPLAEIILFFKVSFQMPSFTRSRSKCLFTTTNSPDSTLLEYMLEVYGSKHSLFPNICDVDAVGIGATNREFLTPYFATSSFKTSHSHLGEGVTFHMSY